MIVQGTNLPLRITFEQNAIDFQSIHVFLYFADESLLTSIKTWATSNNTIDIQGSEIFCPLEQSDTINLEIDGSRNVIIKVVWVDETGSSYNVEFGDYISERQDSTILVEA